MADILFVCVHNAGRSQMAKALFNQSAKARGLQFKADSAGTEPSNHIHEQVVEVMREAGIDLSRARPKVLTDELVNRARRIIIMGCAVDADACPAVLLKRVEDWELPDPRGKSLAEVRAIRDEIGDRVAQLLDDLQKQ